MSPRILLIFLLGSLDLLLGLAVEAAAWLAQRVGEAMAGEREERRGEDDLAFLAEVCGRGRGWV